MDEWGTLIEK